MNKSPHWQLSYNEAMKTISLYSITIASMLLSVFCIMLLRFKEVIQMSPPTPCTMSCMILIIESHGILIYWKALIYAKSALTVILVTMQVSVVCLSVGDSIHVHCCTVTE